MKRIIIILTLLSLSTSIYSQHVFEKAYNGDSYDYGVNVVEIPNEGYFLCTTISEGIWSDNNICVIRTNLQGDTLWTKTFGIDNNYEAGNFINPTSDGGFVLCGINNGKTVVYKIDYEGNHEWDKTYDFIPNWNIGLKIIETSDSNYVVLTYGDGSNLLKINNIGDTIWTKSYNYKLWDLKNTSEGNYIMVGSILGALETENTVILNVDNNGNTNWMKEFDLGYLDRAYSVIETNNNNFALCGMRNQFDTAPFDAFIIVTDNNGDTIFTKQYGIPGFDNDERAFSVCSSGNNYVLTGRDNNETFMLKIDDIGNEIWTKIFSGYKGTHIINTIDDGYAISGCNNSEEIFLIKTDSIGNTINSIGRIRNNTNIEIYPNPTSGSITIQTKNIKIIEILDIHGREVYSGKETKIDLSTQPNGIYIIKITTDKETIKRKIIKQ